MLFSNHDVETKLLAAMCNMQTTARSSSLPRILQAANENKTPYVRLFTDTAYCEKERRDGNGVPCRDLKDCGYASPDAFRRRPQLSSTCAWMRSTIFWLVSGLNRCLNLPWLLRYSTTGFFRSGFFAILRLAGLNSQ